MRGLRSWVGIGVVLALSACAKRAPRGETAPPPSVVVAPAPPDEEGVTTLRSKKWTFAPYFDGVKRALAKHWRPDLAAAGSPPGQRSVLVRVRLDAGGRLLGTTIEKTSGIPSFDDEARAALARAAPFGEPPASLMLDGEIAFSFGFLIGPAGESSPAIRLESTAP